MSNGLYLIATVNEKQTTTISETLTTDVFYNQDSTFKVTVPKKITLESDKTSAYTVTVEGDIASDEVVMVAPDETFEMKDIATTGTAKEPVEAKVSQSKTFWKFNEFETIGNGNINAEKLSAGTWEGSFWFNIKLQSNYISVNAKNEAGEDIHATASNIVGEQKENLLNSLEESGLINSKEEVDALINVKSDDFEGFAETTFDVSNIAQKDDKVAILHFDETKGEWELIGIETVDENSKITGNFTSYSPVVFVKIDELGNYEHMHIYKEIITEATCIKEGVKTFTCRCGDKYTETIPITDHTLTNGKCSVCDYLTPGLYNSSDVLICTWEESGIDVTINYNADNHEKTKTSGYYITRVKYPSTTKIVMPDNIEKIGDYAFNSSFITNIVLPKNLQSIGSHAFGYCTKLVTISIPDKVTTINGYAFRVCSKLQSIVLPSTITKIGGYAFQNNSVLKNVYYKGTSTQWSSINILSGNGNLTSAARTYNYTE